MRQRVKVKLNMKWHDMKKRAKSSQSEGMGNIQEWGTPSQEEELERSEVERLEKVVRERTVQVRQEGAQLRGVSAGATDKKKGSAESEGDAGRGCNWEGATERGAKKGVYRQMRVRYEGETVDSSAAFPN